MKLLALVVLCVAAAGAADLIPGEALAAGLPGWWLSEGLSATVVAADAPQAPRALRLVAAPKPGGAAWEQQAALKLPAAFTTGQQVRFNVYLRSPESCRINLIFQLQKEPYTNYAMLAPDLTPQWQQYTLTATVPADLAAGDAGLNFQVGYAPGTVEIAGLTGALQEDNPLGLLPFVLPWDDASPGITNVADLLPRPAGRDGFVTARDGHLFVGDRRIRFFGTNLCAGAPFASHDTATKVAARMAKFGINCVRFHHMDAGWASPSLFGPDRRTLVPSTLDNLDWFIAELKAQGIYANLNLHVSREYPGMPRWDRMPSFFKGVDLFYPPMIELQKEYARDLLTHLNPYTKTRYVDEPAVAFIEINNENGLISSWWGGGLDPMPAPYVAALTAQWNAWLTKRYPTPAQLQAAWAGSTTPLGDELLTNGSFARGATDWTLEQNGGAKGTLEPVAGPDGARALRATVTAVDGEAWHVQLWTAGLRPAANQVYTLTFQARADSPRSIGVDCRQAHEPWATLYQSRVQLTGAWQRFRLVIQPTAGDENARITFGDLGARTGTVELANVSLRPGGGYELRPADRHGAVAWVPYADYSGLPPAMKADWMRFLWETEEQYWTSMARYLKEELGAKAPIMGSAAGFSPAGVQALLDVVDTHSYWQHPHFPRVAWDGNDWVLPNLAMAGRRGGGTLAGLAGQRIAGKPHAVTEYNHPAPNTHNSEAFLLLAAYGALQDWDALFSFDYHGSSTGWDVGRIPGFFSIDQHPTQMATLPAAAALFLRGDVAAPARRATVGVTREQLIAAAGRAGSWTSSDTFGLAAGTLLRRPVEVALGTAAPAAGGEPAGDVTVSDGGELTWDSRAGQERVLLNTARSKAVIGTAGLGPQQLGPVTIETRPNSQNWAAVTLTALTGELGAAGRYLITATGYAENTAMGWRNPQKDTVGNNWGRAPSLVEGIPAGLRLAVPAARVSVWALDARGQRAGQVPVRDQDGQAAFDLGPDHRTLWYEVEVK